MTTYSCVLVSAGSIAECHTLRGIDSAPPRGNVHLGGGDQSADVASFRPLGSTRCLFLGVLLPGSSPQGLAGSEEEGKEVWAWIPEGSESPSEDGGSEGVLCCFSLTQKY